MPLGEGWEGPFEVGWHQNALYNVFVATWRGLDGSKWRSVGAGVHYIVFGAAGGKLGGSKWMPNGLVMG